MAYARDLFLVEMDGSTETSWRLGADRRPLRAEARLDVLLAARDARLYDAVTDCGAGGLSSAVARWPRNGCRDRALSFGTLYSGRAPGACSRGPGAHLVLAVPARTLSLLRNSARVRVRFSGIGEFGATLRSSSE